MKMDAAEPFNVPVNPEALGIPVSTTMFKLIFHGLFSVMMTLILCLVKAFVICLLQLLP